MAGGNGSAATLLPEDGYFCQGGKRLALIEDEQAHQRARGDRQDESIGKLLGEVAEVTRRMGKPSEEGGLAGTQARMAGHLLEQERRQDRLESKVDRVIDLVTSRQPASDPPPLDYGDDAGEVTKMQPAPLLVRRMKRAETHKKIAIVAAAVVPLVLAIAKLIETFGGLLK